jgi:hypothetical protein
VSGHQVSFSAIIQLADALDQEKLALEGLGTRLAQAADPIDTGAADVDAQTRSVMARVNAATVHCGQVFESLADTLDVAVAAYHEAEERADDDLRESMSRLLAWPAGGPLSS